MWEGLFPIELLLWKMFLLLVPFAMILLVLTGMRFWVRTFYQSTYQTYARIKAWWFA